MSRLINSLPDRSYAHDSYLAKNIVLVLKRIIAYKLNAVSTGVKVDCFEFTHLNAVFHVVTVFKAEMTYFSWYLIVILKDVDFNS